MGRGREGVELQTMYANVLKGKISIRFFSNTTYNEIHSAFLRAQKIARFDRCVDHYCSSIYRGVL